MKGPSLQTQAKVERGSSTKPTPATETGHIGNKMLKAVAQSTPQVAMAKTVSIDEKRKAGSMVRNERTVEAAEARAAAAAEAARTAYTGQHCNWAKSRWEPPSKDVERCYSENMSIVSRAAQAVPSWSPYTKVVDVDPQLTFRTCMQEYGKPDEFSTVLTPAEQSKQARRLVAEMKGTASIDHTWELFGARPGGVKDILTWED